VQDVIAEVQGKFSAIPGVMIFANNPPAFGGSGQPVQFVVRHPDFAKLSLAMDTLVKRARQIPGCATSTPTCG
jgi:multidrug efflux pump subunit AcrB